MIEEIGLCYAFTRAEMLALPMPKIERLFARSLTHLAKLYRLS
jgi:hypothetical protein